MEQLRAAAKAQGRLSDHRRHYRIRTGPAAPFPADWVGFRHENHRHRSQ